MANDDDGEPIAEAELDRMRAQYDGCDADGGPAGLAIQARDRVIRSLIDEVKRERVRAVRGRPAPR